METNRRRNSDRALNVACIAALTTTLASCAQVPPPPFSGPLESVPRNRILEYVARLQFVRDPHLADEQPLIYPAASPQTARVGPIARIEPELRSRRFTRSQLAAGRIIARIISDGAFEPLGIRRGIQYLWVDSAGGRWRAAMIPASGDEPVILDLALGPLAHLTDAPAATWVYDARAGTYANATCGSMCCRPCEPRPPGGFCRNIGQSMLRAGQFGGAAGVPPSRPDQEAGRR